MSRKIVPLVLSFCLLFQQIGFSQVAAELNIASYFSKIGSSIVQDKFRPLHLRYFSYDSLNDNFKVLLDKGDFKNLKNPELESSTKTLLSYFLVGVTLSDDMFWVNLRPDSEDQIIDPYLEKTDVGKIMLEADLQLKKDTSSFTSPQTPEGREYWDKLYKKVAEIYGYDNVTIPTLTRPWIVPGEIIVRESKDSAYIYKATLKVMLEQDCLKDSATYNFKDERSKALNEYASQLARELIIPKLTKEVNSAKRYASLRQVYYSLILARWFKLRFTGKTGTYASFINTRNLTNLASQESWSKNTYFKQYQKSFSEGEYNVKEPVYTPTGQVIRSYFSGGINVAAGVINTQNGIILPNDNAARLGDVIGGKATVDLQSVSLHPVVVSPTEDKRSPDGRFKEVPGKNPQDALQVITQSHYLQQLLKAQGYFTLKDFLKAYAEEAPKLGYAPLAENPESTARRDLYESKGSLVNQGVLTIENRGVKGEPYRFILASIGNNTKKTPVATEGKEVVSPVGDKGEYVPLKDHQSSLSYLEMVNSYSNDRNNRKALSEDEVRPGRKKFHQETLAAEPFSGNTIIVNFDSNTNEKLKEVKQKIKKSLEENGLGNKVAFVQDNSFHLTIYDLINPDDLPRIRSEEPEYANKTDDEIRTIVIQRISEAFQELKNEGRLDSIVLNIKRLGAFAPFLLLALAYPNGDEDLAIINTIRGKIFEKTKIRAPFPFVAHVTLGYIVNPMNEREYATYREIVNTGMRDMGFEVSIDFRKMELSDFSDMNKYNKVFEANVASSSIEDEPLSKRLSEAMQLLRSKFYIKNNSVRDAVRLIAEQGDETLKQEVVEIMFRLAKSGVILSDQDYIDNVGFMDSIETLETIKESRQILFAIQSIQSMGSIIALESLEDLGYEHLGRNLSREAEKRVGSALSEAIQTLRSRLLKNKKSSNPISIEDQIKQIIRREYRHIWGQYLRDSKFISAMAEIIRKGKLTESEMRDVVRDYAVKYNEYEKNGPYPGSTDPESGNDSSSGEHYETRLKSDSELIDEFAIIVEKKIQNRSKKTSGIDEPLTERLNEAIQLIRKHYNYHHDNIRDAVRLIAGQGDEALKQEVVNIMFRLAKEKVEVDYDHFEQVWDGRGEMAIKEEERNVLFAIEMIKLIGGNIAIVKLEELIEGWSYFNETNRKKSAALEAIRALKSTGKFKEVPGKNPQDALQVITQSHYLQQLLKAQGYFTLKDFLKAYAEEAPKLGYAPLAENPESTARRDLYVSEDSLVKQGILTIENQGTRGEPYRFVIKDIGKNILRKSISVFVTLTVNTDLQGLDFTDAEKAIASGKMAIAEVSVDWAKKIRETYPDDVYTIFISPLSEEQIKGRMQKNGQTREKVILAEMAERQRERAVEKPTSEDKQFARAQAAITEMSRQGEYDTVIVSNELKDLEKDNIRWVGVEGARVVDQFMGVVNNARKSGKKLILYSGPSATGKSPLWDQIKQKYGDQFSRIVLYTTRSMRPGEEEGVDYYFRTVEQLQKLEKKLNAPTFNKSTRNDLYIPRSVDEAYDSVTATLTKIRGTEETHGYPIFEPKIDKNKVGDAFLTKRAAEIGSVVCGYDTGVYSHDYPVTVNLAEGMLVLGSTEDYYYGEITRHLLERPINISPLTQAEKSFDESQIRKQLVTILHNLRWAYDNTPLSWNEKQTIEAVEEHNAQAGPGTDDDLYKDEVPPWRQIGMDYEEVLAKMRLATDAKITEIINWVNSNPERNLKGEEVNVLSGTGQEAKVIGRIDRGIADKFGFVYESDSSPTQGGPQKPGGIDFRALPMIIQPMGSFSGLNFKLPQLSQAELERINVSSEIRQINNMVQSGITPSGERIKELVAACIQKNEINYQIDNLLLCLAGIFKLEEINASESSSELKESLVIVDSQS